MNLTLISNDTEIIGDVDESTLGAYYINVPFSSSRKVYSLDRTGGSLNITDDTTIATAGTTDSWSPFGTNTIPASATLKVYDSTDGVWATNELTATAKRANGTTHTNVIDCLKNTGWCKIEFGENANRQNWVPTNDPASNMPERRYIRFELNDGSDNDSFIVACAGSDITAVYLNITTAGSTSTEVKVADIVLVRKTSDIKWNNIITVVNGDTSTSYTPANDTAILVEGTQVYFGLANKGFARETYVFRGSGVPQSSTVFNVEYSTSGNAFSSLEYTSGSDFFTDPTLPQTIATSSTHRTDSWDPPADWAKQSLSFAIEGGTTEITEELYWIRFTVPASEAVNFPTNNPVYRLRVRQYGNGNVRGIPFTEGGTLKSISMYIRGAVSGTGDRKLNISNLNTGESRTVTIPGTTVQGAGISLQFDDLTFSAEDEMGIITVNGGISLQDVVTILNK